MTTHRNLLGKISEIEARAQKLQPRTIITGTCKVAGAPKSPRRSHERGKLLPINLPGQVSTMKTSSDCIAAALTAAQRGFRILLPQTGHGRVRRRHRQTAQRSGLQRAICAGPDPGAETGFEGVHRRGEGEGGEGEVEIGGAGGGGLATFLVFKRDRFFLKSTTFDRAAKGAI